jgi:hypothetical protein
MVRLSITSSAKVSHGLLACAASILTSSCFGSNSLSEGGDDRQKQNLKTAPGEWSKQIDQSTLHAYWINERTGESKWDVVDYNPPSLADRWDDRWDKREQGLHNPVNSRYSSSPYS